MSETASEPPSDPPELKARLARPKALVRAGQMLEAVQEMEGLTEADPESPSAWARAASVYIALRMRERAMTMLAQAVMLEHEPNLG